MADTPVLSITELREQLLRLAKQAADGAETLLEASDSALAPQAAQLIEAAANAFRAATGITKSEATALDRDRRR